MLFRNNRIDLKCEQDTKALTFALTLFPGEISCGLYQGDVCEWVGIFVLVHMPVFICALAI